MRAMATAGHKMGSYRATPEWWKALVRASIQSPESTYRLIFSRADFFC
jgi:hypothetical protein